MADTITHRTVSELLAPAGNLAAAITAYESGADAVYCGLPRFNAREMGQNFSYDDLSRLAGYAHGNGKSFYVTFNTLLKEQELEAAAADLQRISALEPHGVIVQDLGVVRMLRELFPEIPIHASTQMGIHNSAGIRTAARLGIRRVILERQVSIDELETIMERAPIEVEVFIHGALCCSLSGRCLFSSWIGGWSGNRGKCKQPCRRRYYTREEGRKRAGFFFSTKDLYSLDMLQRLTGLGVTSLKIEGRLKKPDYVQSVVSAYRMVLNDIAEGRRPDIRAARAVLAESYGRKWSHGFATAEDRSSVVVPENIGVSGMRIGRVAGHTPEGLQVELRRKLRVGDRVRVQPESGDEGPAVTVRSLYSGGRKVKSVTEGKAVIPTERELPQEGFLYRIGSSRRIPGPKPEDLPPYQPPRRFDLQVDIGLDSAELEVHAVERRSGREYRWSSPLQVEHARDYALDEHTVRQMFAATRTSALAPGSIRVWIEENAFVPLSRLKQRRREFWSWLEQQLPAEEEQQPPAPDPTDLLKKLRRCGADVGSGGQSGSGRRDSADPLAVPGEICAVENGADPPATCGRAVAALRGPLRAGQEAELPHFIPEHRLQSVQQRLSALTAGAGPAERGNQGAQKDKPGTEEAPAAFRATDLSHFALLQQAGAKNIVTGYPLPVTNSLAVLELQGLGCARVQAWVELDREAMRALLDAAALPIEAYVYGRPFLLATRAHLPAEGGIVDGRGKEFYIRQDEQMGLTYLYPSEVLRIEAPAGAVPFRDLRGLPPASAGESSFNYEIEFI
jgi:putative protease